MTRLANIEKGGYFPIPREVTQMIISKINAPSGGRVLDPCAGKGQALYDIAKALKMEPYGVELHHDRATQAQALIGDLGTILHAPYQNIDAPQKSFQLLYLNPPYDHDAEDGRLEYKWLKDTRKYLVMGGVLVYVVPSHILRMAKATRYISSWFENVRVTRFPGETYDLFKQVVVIGTHRQKAVAPNTSRVNYWRNMSYPENKSMPELKTTSSFYELPALTDSKFYFKSTLIDPNEAIKQALGNGVVTRDDWQTHMIPGQAKEELRPLTPLKVGHMVNVMAAGYLNNQILDDGQERLLIKGRNYKKMVDHEMTEPTPGGGSKTTTTRTEVVVTDITTIDRGGEIVSHKNGTLEDFLAEWAPQLTQIVSDNHQPVYKFDLNGYGKALSSLSLSRPIPGMNGMSGLLPAQKHATAAILTHLETGKDAHVVGEMGTGKTTIGSAIAAVRKAKRTIILCPPHLVDKWCREAVIVWENVVTMKLETITDVNNFFNSKHPYIIGVLKQTSARAASGWEHAYEYGGSASHNYGQKKYKDVMINGKPGDILKKSSKGGASCPNCGAVAYKNGVPISPTEMKGAQWKCHKCKSPLYQFTRRGDSRGSFLEYARRESTVRNGGGELTSPTPRDFIGSASYPLAKYIQKVSRGRLSLLLIDEIHQYKGFDSDQGYAMHHLACAAKKVVGLTGTIYGGKASSIFHLLYRTNGRHVKAYTNNRASGKRRLKHKHWVSSYGILQAVETKHYDEHGRQTGNSKSNVRYKELPGGSPAMITWLLNNSVFLSLHDMGFPLPPYEEVPVTISMTSDQQSSYDKMKSDLQDELKNRLIRGDKSLLSAYLYALLFWPDTPWRSKTIICPRSGKQVAHVDALPEGIYPKEQAIIDLVKEEKANGRKVLLLCAQTDKLDIQPYWKDMLEKEGIKTSILRAAPNKREGWVAKQVTNGVDVIISHPKKVETGIDLLDFPSIVWMAPHYSVYTVLQASRRSWRIGQTKPVKVYYFAYEDTIQESALSLVAAKVAASLRVNGDAVTGEGLTEMDEITSGDIVSTLARIVTGQDSLPKNSLQEAFSTANSILKDNRIGGYQIYDTDPQGENLPPEIDEDCIGVEIDKKNRTVSLIDPVEPIQEALMPDDTKPVQLSIFG